LFLLNYFKNKHQNHQKTWFETDSQSYSCNSGNDVDLVWEWGVDICCFNGEQLLWVIILIN